MMKISFAAHFWWRHLSRNKYIIMCTDYCYTDTLLSLVTSSNLKRNGKQFELSKYIRSIEFYKVYSFYRDEGNKLFNMDVRYMTGIYRII